MANHWVTFIEKYPELAFMGDAIHKSLDILVWCYNKGKTRLVCGNGSSATDSEYIVG